MLNIEQVIKAIESRVTYTLACEYEDDVTPEESFGDRDDSVEWVRAELARGNEWAWFRAKVTASLGGFEGHDHLGGCSYRNKADFMAPGGYYDDMKSEALHALAMRIMESAATLCVLGFEVTYGVR